MTSSSSLGAFDYGDGGMERLEALSEPLSLGNSKPDTSAALSGLAETIEHVIVPRLLKKHASLPAAQVATIQVSDSAKLADLTTQDDPALATAFVRTLLERGIPFQTVLLDVLAPAARILGDKWVNDACSFVDVTIGVARMHRILRDFDGIPKQFWSTAGEGHRALLMPVPGEQHTFGLRLVEEFLLRDAWMVDNHTFATEAELEVALQSEHYDFVGVSLSGETLISQLHSAIRSIRVASQNRHIRVIVGGVIFSEQPALVKTCGADAYAPDAHGAVRLANAWAANRTATTH